MSRLLHLQRDLKKHQAHAAIFSCQDIFLEACGASLEEIKETTGFTGSTASCLVTNNHLYLCVDGRYLSQATQQCAHRPEVKVFCGSPVEALNTVSLETVGPLQVLFQGWKTSAFLAQSYGKTPHVFKDSSYSILESSCEKEIIGDPWQEWNRYIGEIEATPVSHEVVLLAYPMGFQERCAVLFQKAFPERPPCIRLLLCSLQDIAWLFQLRCHGARPYLPLLSLYAIVRWDSYKGQYQGSLFCSKLQQPSLEKCIHEDNSLKSVVAIHRLETFGDALLEAGASYAYSLATIPHTLHTLLKPSEEKIPTPLFYDDKRIKYLRSRKTQWELYSMRQCHFWESLAFITFLHWLQTLSSGLLAEQTEKSVALKLEHFRRQCPHYRGPSFATISAFGPNGANIHHTPTETPLGRGLFLIDAGGQYFGEEEGRPCHGTTDTTRTLWLGQEPSLQGKREYTMVLQGHLQVASLKSSRKMTGAQLDAVARSFLLAQGMDYPHSTGHGVGFYSKVHEDPPTLSTNGGLYLEEGMIFSNEPGYYRKGWGGIRLENLMSVVHENGFYRFQCLPWIPFQRELIISRELNTPQLDWLNRYHEGVFMRMSPALSGEVQEWLKTATMPI